MTAKQLLRAASEAGSSGQRWTSFWREHEDAVRAAERHHTLRFRRLVNRLIAAWAKTLPSGPAPWDIESRMMNPPTTAGIPGENKQEHVHGTFAGT